MSLPMSASRNDEITEKMEEYCRRSGHVPADWVVKEVDDDGFLPDDLVGLQTSINEILKIVGISPSELRDWVARHEDLLGEWTRAWAR